MTVRLFASATFVAILATGCGALKHQEESGSEEHQVEGNEFFGSSDYSDAKKSVEERGYYVGLGDVDFRPDRPHTKMLIQLLNDQDQPVVGASVYVGRLSDDWTPPKDPCEVENECWVKHDKSDEDKPDDLNYLALHKKKKDRTPNIHDQELVGMTIENRSSNVFTVIIAADSAYEVEAYARGYASNYQIIQFDKRKPVRVAFPIRLHSSHWDDDDSDDRGDDEGDDDSDDRGEDESDEDNKDEDRSDDYVKLKYCDADYDETESDLLAFRDVLEEELPKNMLQIIVDLETEGYALVGCNNEFPSAQLLFERNDGENIMQRDLKIMDAVKYLDDYYYW